MGYLSATVFDSAQKGAAVTLSGSDLVATVSSGTGHVRGSHPISGLTYFEMTLGATLSGSSTIGVAAGNAGLTSLVGAGDASVGYNKDGTVKINNSNVATIMTYTASDRIGVAVDWARLLIWFRKNNGNWNNDVIGNQNPVGAVGGISLANLVGGTVFPAWGGSATASATAAFASGSWTDTAPTGYSTVDTLQPSALSVLNGGADLMAAKSVALPAFPGAKKVSGIETRIFQPGNKGSPAAATVAISGQTRVGGVATGSILVRMYDTRTGEMLDEGYSDGSGNFSFLAQSRDTVYVAAFDPTYQALIFDQVVPV